MIILHNGQKWITLGSFSSTLKMKGEVLSLFMPSCEMRVISSVISMVVFNCFAGTARNEVLLLVLFNSVFGSLLMLYSTVS